MTAGPPVTPSWRLGLSAIKVSWSASPAHEGGFAGNQTSIPYPGSAATNLVHPIRCGTVLRRCSTSDDHRPITEAMITTIDDVLDQLDQLAEDIERLWDQLHTFDLAAGQQVRFNDIRERLSALI